MSSTVVAILTLAIGLLIGLALGYLIAGRRISTDGASAAEFVSVRAERDLYKSERDNAMAGSKLATEVEAMKTAMEKLQKEAADADRRRIEAESDIRTQVRAMSTHNESLVVQTKAIAGALSNSQTRGKFGEAQLELMLQGAGLRKDIEYTAPMAAGVIHTDFQKGFIKAEIVRFNDLIECGSMAEAKAKGKVRMEGKEYVMADGDVVEFRFNV